MIYSRFIDSSQSGGMVLRDTWCLACDGTGMADCENPNCQNGVILGKEVVSGGFNPITKGELYKEQITRDRCSSCRGIGKKQCTACEKGHLP